MKRVLSVLTVFPCMMIRNLYVYRKSHLAGISRVGKDVFLPLPRQRWPRLAQDNEQDHKATLEKGPHTLWMSRSSRCVMINDSDYPKHGIHTEMIGRGFSHVTHGMILGFNSLEFAISDGKTRMVINHELVGEPGKKGTRSQSEKEAEGRYCKKDRGKGSPAVNRIGNYTKQL